MLVVIGAEAKSYKRYSGKTCVLKTVAIECLTPAEVELFRTNPNALTEPTEPQLA